MEENEKCLAKCIFLNKSEITERLQFNYYQARLN